MAINASYGHGHVLRSEGMFPPKAIRADFTPTVTNNSQYRTPAYKRPQPTSSAARRSIQHRTFGGKIGNIDVLA